MKSLAQISILIFIVYGCSNFNKNETSQNTFVDLPIVIDTTHFKTTIKTQKTRYQRHYPPYYLGAIKDSITIGYNINSYPAPPPPPPPKPSELKKLGNKKDSIKLTPFKPNKGQIMYQKYFVFPLPKNIENPDSNSISIIVDTSKTIKSLDFLNFQDQTFAFEANPIFIFNKSSKTIKIGVGSSINLTLQVKDSLNNWTSLDQPLFYGCGTGLTRIILPQKEIAISSIPKYKEGKQSLVRLKLGNNYSNQFYRKIKTTR